MTRRELLAWLVALEGETVSWPVPIPARDLALLTGYAKALAHNRPATRAQARAAKEHIHPLGAPMDMRWADALTLEEKHALADRVLPGEDSYGEPTRSGHRDRALTTAVGPGSWMDRAILRQQQRERA